MIMYRFQFDLTNNVCHAYILSIRGFCHFLTFLSQGFCLAGYYGFLSLVFVLWQKLANPVFLGQLNFSLTFRSIDFLL